MSRLLWSTLFPYSSLFRSLGEVVAAPLIVGAVLSMLIPATVVLALLPALSVAVPLDDWALPSARVASAAQLWIAAGVSAQLKCTVTTLLYQQAAVGEVVAAPPLL